MSLTDWLFVAFGIAGVVAVLPSLFKRPDQSPIKHFDDNR